MTIEVHAYDPSTGREADFPVDVLAPWHPTLLELESAKRDLVSAVQAGEPIRMPTTFPSNGFARTLYFGAWIVFKRGVPPRGAVKALPCFDPEVFLSPGEDPRWESDGQTAHLQPAALGTTLRAMTKLTRFLPPDRRALWSAVRDLLQDLESRGLTLRCSWLED